MFMKFIRALFAQQDQTHGVKCDRAAARAEQTTFNLRGGCGF